MPNILSDVAVGCVGRRAAKQADELLQREWIPLGNGHSTSLKLLTWNILDDEFCVKYNLACVEEYEHDAESICQWSHRLPLIIDEICRQDPNVIAFQEVGPDMFKDLQEELMPLGFSGISDGEVWTTAVFWRAPWVLAAWASEASEAVNEQHGRLNFHRLSNAAQSQCRSDSRFFRAIGVALEIPGGQDEKVAIANIHTDWRDTHNRETAESTVQVGQCEQALSLVAEACKRADWCIDVPTVLCGDFNRCPKLLGKLTYGQAPLLNPYEFSGAFERGSEFTYRQHTDPCFPIIDGILHTQGLEPTKVLRMRADPVLRGRDRIPHAEFPSDHVPLGCHFALSRPSATQRKFISILKH